jgi:release factor glutamine methyltransferase
MVLQKVAMTTINEAIQKIAFTLSQNNYPQSYLGELRWFLGFPTFSATPLTVRQMEIFEGVLSDLLAQKPVEYIVKRALFLEHYFYVDERVLIPRFDTEAVALFAIETQRNLAKNATIIDIGTGSSAIICSIALALQETQPEQVPTFIAIDISEDALTVAMQNANSFNLSEKITFQKAETIPQNGKNEPLIPTAENIIIITNPPYLSQESMNTLPESVKRYEPEIALLEQKDFIPQLQKYIDILRTNGKTIHLAIEYANTDGTMIQRFANSFQGDLPTLLLP